MASATENPWQWLTLQHDGFRTLFARWSQTTEPQVKRQIALDLNATIVSHASVEEQHLHELYRKYLPKDLGDRYFAESLEADNSIRGVLYQLEHLNYDDPAALMRAEVLMRELVSLEMEHMPSEESVFFPALAAKMTPSEQAQLYRAMVASKPWAPIASHPSAPDKPLLSKITHPVAGVLDRAADAARGQQRHVVTGGQPGQPTSLLHK